MTASTGNIVELNEPFERALERTRDALKAEGFGIITEVDIRATFREKIDREFRPYVILGACNPALAYSALSTDPNVGLLLPCNVTVEAGPGEGSVVRLVDPVMLMTGTGLAASPELERVAADAQGRLARVAVALAGETKAAV